MTDNLVNIITQYLKIETNYAVIINGEYGTGKTFFFKNELSDNIKKISLPKDERKKFTPIHISLFGLKSIEEIQTEIFVELYPILKSKKVKLAANIGKTIVRGIIGDIDDYIGDLSQTKDNFINYDELVLCFDDLDRKSDDLNVKDVFGFINSIVENQAAKVLIIANEKQLLKDPNYTAELREKVIGVSIQFKPNPETVFLEIIKKKYSSADNIYYNFLLENKKRIVEIIEINENNFRNLVFFLEHFKTIFYPLHKEFTENKGFRALKDDKLNAVLNFTLAIAIDYKLGLINVSNFKEIEEFDNHPFANLKFDDFIASTRPSKKETEKEEVKAPPFIETFKSKYYKDNKYYFFRSIFEYIIGIKSFEISSLVSELNNYFIVKDGKVPESEQILISLGYNNCLKLSSIEYRQQTKRMLELADTGQYKLQQYATVFHFAVRFNNMLDFSLPKLKKRLVRGINKAKKTHTYVSDLGFYMTISSDTEFKDDLTEIIKYCIKVNDDTQVKNENENILHVFSLFVKDHEKFIELVSDDRGEFRFQPFWLQFDPKKVCILINRLTPDQTWRFGHYITRRYRKHIYEKLYPEKDFLIELNSLINVSTAKRQKKNLKNASLDYLTKSINEAIGNFP